MRTFTAAMVMVASLVGPAYAQKKPATDQKTPMQLIEEKRAQETAEIDRQYNAMKKTTKSTDPAAAKSDPWGNMRSVSPPREKR